MVDKLMDIPNNDKQNYSFCKLKLVVKTFDMINEMINQSKFKVPKVLRSSTFWGHSKSTFSTAINQASFI